MRIARFTVDNDIHFGAVEGARPGAVTMDIRKQLLDIQTGRAEDPHGWLTRLV